MNKTHWKKTIKQQAEGCGTYRKEFDPLINTLADILEQRDDAYDEYINTGAQKVVEVTSDRGAVNMRKNPRLQIWEDLNKQAMDFWKEMGLSPSSLKKMNEAALKPQKAVSALEEAIKKFGGG